MKYAVSVVVLLSALLSAASPLRAQTPVDAGFRDFSYGTGPSSTATGEKPESKLWWNDGSWWGSLFNPQANQYRIYRFDATTQGWTDTGTALDLRRNTKADVLWDEASGRLYVASHVFSGTGNASGSSSQWGRLYRYSYNPTTRQYTLESGFPVNVTRGNGETLTIAKDSAQRLWVTYVESGRVKINWSGAHDLDWGLPVNLPVDASAATVNTDDISAVVAFGSDSVGVMWSNQKTKQVFFAIHRDVDPPTVWQPIETVLPSANCTGSCADDHINLKTDQQGRVFAALKTSLTSTSQPLTMLAVRATTGVWSTHVFGLVQNHHTRPIVVLDESHNQLYMFASTPEAGGAIHYKTSPLDNIALAPGPGQVFIDSATDLQINNATSTKQNVSGTTGLLVLASDEGTRFYLHNYLSLGGQPPAPPADPTNLAASAVSASQVNLTWVDNSNVETSFHIERASGGGAFAAIDIVSANVVSYSDTTVAASTSYEYRVRANNAGGFSGYSNIAVATTPAPTPTAPAAPTNLSATAISSSQIDLAWTDASSNEDAFHIERTSGAEEFAEIATVGANVTTYSDTTVSASTGYQYRVRARNVQGFSSYSGVASATTPGPNQPIKDITFEAGSLTDATTGVGKVIGTVSLESGAPLKGLYASRIPNAVSSYLEESFGATDDVYVSLYVRIDALPASAPRIVLISNAGISVGNLLLQPSGRLRLRIDTAIVGADSAPLAIGQLYRIGIHQKKGNGGSAVLEAFLATADSQFAAPFAATSTGTWTTAADRLRVGATNPSAVNIVLDDIRLDAAAMPGPSQ